MVWGSCPETTQVASGLHCLLNNLFISSPMKSVGDKGKNANEARLHGMGSFLLKEGILEFANGVTKMIFFLKKINAFKCILMGLSG